MSFRGFIKRKSMGLDGIGPNVLKHCALPLCELLRHLFQVSLDAGSLPSEWKIHNITPIPKSKDRMLVSNYRPISLLSSTSKVLERIIFTRCLSILEPAITKCAVRLHEGSIFTTATIDLLPRKYITHSVKVRSVT